MEAASRPTIAPLTDLPVEAPSGPGASIPSDGSRGAGASAPSGPPAGAVSKDAPKLPQDEFLVDPEAILLGTLNPPSLSAMPDPRPAAKPDASLTPSSPLSRLADRGPATASKPAVSFAPTTKPAQTAPTSPTSESTLVIPTVEISEFVLPEPAAALPSQSVVGTPATPSQSVVVAPAPQSAASPPSASITPSAVSAPSTSTVPNGASPSASPAMDRDFIARNQIVERYLSGRLPLKGAADFERFCRENPQVLDELGLPERVNAGVRLLEASGKPEPWQEAPRSRWVTPQIVIGLAAGVLILGIVIAVAVSHSSAKSERIAKLQQQLIDQPLEAATSTRAIRVMPSREGASNTPAVVISHTPAQLIDLKIDEARSAYKLFRITIDRTDQGRVAVLHNLAKDSNGHVRIALNSSALGPGNYQLTIEGLTWRGDAEPDSWVTIGIR